MPTHGAQQRALEPGCNSSDVVPCTATRHGTTSARARQGCTCETARLDKKRYTIGYALGYRRTTDATGTRRRIQALMAIGWTGRHVMTAIGWPGASLGAQMYQGDRVYVDTAQRVRDVYDRLSATPGPSDRTRRRAARAGWLPPLAWDDDTIDDPQFIVGNIQILEDKDNLFHACHDVDQVAIDRRLDGDTTVRLTRAEKKYALAQLVTDGHSLTAAANRLGINGTYARKYVAELNVVNDCHDARVDVAS